MIKNISAYSRPWAWATTTLYTATGSEIIATILVSNVSIATTFSMWYVPNTESVWDLYAFPKWATIAANDEIDFTRPVTLNKWDTIQVSSVSGNVTFALFWQGM